MNKYKKAFRFSTGIAEYTTYEIHYENRCYIFSTLLNDVTGAFLAQDSDKFTKVFRNGKTYYVEKFVIDFEPVRLEDYLRNEINNLGMT